MADNTIDTLKIKVEGEGNSAESTLDKLLKKLERIKAAATGGSKASAFNKQIGSLKSKVDSLKSDKLEKISAQASRDSKRIEDITARIRDMETSFSDKPTYAMQKLLDKEKELEAEAVRIKDQLSSISTPLALAEKYTNQYNGIRGQIEQISAKQLELQDNGKAFLTVAQAQPEAYQKLNDQLSNAVSKTKEFDKQKSKAFSGSTVNSFTSKLKKLASSIKRIAFYRTIRSIMNQITDGFKTGMDDMYQYSKTFSGEYARSMDQLASANLTYKNSIGAIMAPVVNLVVPWLDKVVDKLVDINNAAAMVIAGLTGKSTYSKAVRVTTEYAEAANKASNNTAKVKDRVEELKRSLAGLDEITIIGENLSPVSSVSGGNDSVIKPGLDYGSMFVETPVDMAKVNEIKEKFEKILEVAKWIGLAIAAWKLATFISSIGQAISSLGTLSKTMLGLTMMIAGFGIEFAGAYDIGKNGLNLKNALMTALGAALGVAGSLLVFGTGPLGWTIGFTVALTVGIVGYLKGAWAKAKEIYELTDSYRELSESISRSEQIYNRASEALDRLSQAKSNLDKVLGTYLPARSLVNEIFDLYEKSNLSTNELEELRIKVETLNDLGLDSLKLEFDDTKGVLYQVSESADGTTQKIEATRTSVNNLIESLQEEAQAAAMMSILTEAYKSYYQALIDDNIASNEVKKTTERLEKAQAALNKGFKDHTSSTNILAQASYFLTDEYRQLKLELDQAQEAVNEATKSQKENGNALKTSKEYIDSVTQSLVDLKNNGGNFADQAIQSGRALSDSLTTASSDALRLRESLSNLQGFSGNYSYSFSNTPKYATGGFPEDGLFFANHNELVGQFANGKTAVANNEQIVEGIRGGVASANEEQNQLLREQNRLLRALLSKDSTISVSTITSAMDRQNRRNGKVTVPVGT